jgi:hypothetical protein
MLTRMTDEDWDRVVQVAANASRFVDYVQTSLENSVRPDGAVCQWRKVPPSELSVALVADERFGGATHRAEAS